MILASFPIGLIWHNMGDVANFTMEIAALIGLILFLASEIIPHTPLKGNGVVEAIIEGGMKVFPKPEADEE